MWRSTSCVNWKVLANQKRALSNIPVASCDKGSYLPVENMHGCTWQAHPAPSHDHREAQCDVCEREKSIILSKYNSLSGCSYRINSHYTQSELIFQRCLLIPWTKPTPNESQALRVGRWYQVSVTQLIGEAQEERRSHVTRSYSHQDNTSDHSDVCVVKPHVEIKQQPGVNVCWLTCYVAVMEGWAAGRREESQIQVGVGVGWWRGGVIEWESEDV